MEEHEKRNQDELIAELIKGLDYHSSQGTGHMTVMKENDAIGVPQKGMLDEDDIRIAESNKKIIEKKPKRKLI